MLWLWVLVYLLLGLVIFACSGALQHLESPIEWTLVAFWPLAIFAGWMLLQLDKEFERAEQRVEREVKNYAPRP